MTILTACCIALIAAGLAALVYEQANEYRALDGAGKKTYRIETIGLVRSIAIGVVATCGLLLAVLLLAELGSAP